MKHYALIQFALFVFAVITILCVLTSSYIPAELKAGTAQGIGIMWAFLGFGLWCQGWDL